MAAKVEVIEMHEISPKMARITICGDGDLILNRMNDVVKQELIDKRKDRAKKLEKPNFWEQVMTSIHWYDGTPKDFTKEGFVKALEENKPCITAFGLKKSFCQTVVRNGFDKYSTKFDASVNVVARGGLVPISFTEHYIDEKLMSPQKGSPVLVNLNRFTGWSATFDINYIDSIYSIEQIANIIAVAGFGAGIGSGRSSGFGRYHITNIEAI